MPKAKPKTPHGTAHLVWAVEGEHGIIKINGECYTIEYVAPDKPEHPVVYRLTKKDGVTKYELHRDKHGVGCTCPNYVYARANSGQPCKHGAGLVACGLLLPAEEPHADPYVPF